MKADPGICELLDFRLVERLPFVWEYHGVNLETRFSAKKTASPHRVRLNVTRNHQACLVAPTSLGEEVFELANLVSAINQ
jgi:hypothetical protein